MNNDNKHIYQVTPTQYAIMRGISLQAVTDGLRKKREQPGIVKVQKFGRFYLLDIDVTLI